MGRWVLEEACRQMKGWQQSHTRDTPLTVIVNFSAKQLRHPGCAEAIGEALERSGLEARSLSLDVTESVFVDAFEANTLALKQIENLGVRLSIDDFGTGYSSLSYLKRLPAKVLKIDKSFVGGLGEYEEDTAIVRMVIDLAHSLGMEVVAEGVETEGRRPLGADGCDMAQGFHFARPCPPKRSPSPLGQVKALGLGHRYPGRAGGRLPSSCSVRPSILLALYSPSAWKGYSANFGLRGFSEVAT
jgi:EAL domain-containing protein (putative c-di-GMP-specific phosphodiesterase class I)